jgi:hypothetical protein
MYATDKTEQFTIYTDRGVTNLIVQADLPRQYYKPLFELGLIYGPIVLLANIQDRDNPAYAITQQGDQVDLQWLLSAISHFEEGWYLENGVLFSPVPSHVSHAGLRDSLLNARRLAIA